MDCKECHRHLRPAKTKIADHPGTVLHYGQGYCMKCFIRVAPEPERTARPDDCVVCEKPLRPATAKSADYPGTVRHKAYGKCWNCYKKERRANQAVDADDLTVQADAPAELAQELQHLANERKARAERAERIRLARAAQEAARARFLASRRAA